MQKGQPPIPHQERIQSTTKEATKQNRSDSKRNKTKLLTETISGVSTQKRLNKHNKIPSIGQPEQTGFQDNYDESEIQNAEPIVEGKEMKAEDFENEDKEPLED